MPLPNFANIQGNPMLLLPWLNQNLLLATNNGLIPNVANPPGTANMTIAAHGGFPQQALAVNAHGAPMDVYEISNVGVNVGNQLTSYICNYTAGAANMVHVGMFADFCFTVNMNGCTLGIGPVGPGGDRDVVHANNAAGPAFQRGQVQASLGVGANLAGVTLLEPSQYRHLGVAGLQATTFGILDGANWRFYFQSFTYHGQGAHQVHGVFPIL
jgi:hypothetical protein